MTVENRVGRELLRAWHGEMDLSGLLAFAAELEAKGLWPLVALLYQTWLKRNTSPFLHAGYFNLGIALGMANDLESAEGAYRHALSLAPSFIHPHLNLANIYERTGRVDLALIELRWVAENANAELPEHIPLLQMALNSLGRLLEIRKEYGAAITALSRSLGLVPNQPDVLHHWVYLRQKQCAWPIYQPLPGVTAEMMQEATSALAMINVSDDPAAQLTAARRYVEKKMSPALPRLSRHEAYGHRKIRVGFCSSDFSLHPVSMLTVQLYELLDRENFEVFAYCWSPEDGSGLRQRVIAAIDHFVRIDRMSDASAAEKICQDEIDILFDLQGQTAGARPNILGYRPAPIQITYLGLPATTGMSCIDYVIADRFLIPEDVAPFYSEKPLYMPDVFQVSDRKRPVGPRPNRRDNGLPEEGFIFCSFNNNFKYTPEVFTVWMNILRRVPGSVLWLLADNPEAQSNLRREAQSRGIEEKRLVFATRVSPENYLARYMIADLFLDSFPFNAGTTANDALWMELPVLTRSGRAFAARMAGALLTAAGLDELITYDLEAYEEKAVSLANHPAALAQFRERLKAVKESGALFDTPRFVRHLETRLKELVAALPVAGTSATGADDTAAF